jgi:hypothetical protein
MAERFQREFYGWLLPRYFEEDGLQGRTTGAKTLQKSDMQTLHAAFVRFTRSLDLLIYVRKMFFECIKDDFAFACDADKSLGAVEKRDAPFLFQRRNILTHDRLGNMEFLSRFGIVLTFRDGKKTFYLSIVHQTPLPDTKSIIEIRVVWLL